MTKDVYLNLAGLDLIVEVEYEDDSVCGVMKVKDCAGRPLNCDITRFYKDLAIELQESLENAIADERTAYYENLMDSRKEEGKL